MCSIYMSQMRQNNEFKTVIHFLKFKPPHILDFYELPILYKLRSITHLIFHKLGNKVKLRHRKDLIIRSYRLNLYTIIKILSNNVICLLKRYLHKIIINKDFPRLVNLSYRRLNPKSI